MSSVLDKIIAHKRVEVAQGKLQTSISDFEKIIANLPACRPFAQQLIDKASSGQNAVIAEIKKASPSKGVIREHFDPVAIAQSYQKGGATCLSVLTDSEFFQGSSDYLKAAHSAVTLPIIRKDFIIDPWQVYESRAMGADCILLIAAALSSSQLSELNKVAQALSIEVLVEVHSEQELRIAESINAKLVGVNNRNLHDFSISLNVSETLMTLKQNDSLMISESGIKTSDDVQRLNKVGIYSFLVGEHFMRADEPGDALHQLFNV